MARPVNEVYADYRAAPAEVQGRFAKELDQALRQHAYAICWLTLHEVRPDIVNFAVFKAFANMHKFRGEAGFATWFQHIVQNLCFDEGKLRTRLNERGLDDLSQDELAQISVEIGGDARLELERLTKDLNADDRAFLERKLAGEDETELSEELGLTREGVRSKWNRIKKRILRQLHQQRDQSTAAPTAQ